MPHDDHSHSLLPSDPALRVKALETLLVEKGLVDPAALDEIIDTYSHKIGPQNGAKVVAKAWVNPDFRAECCNKLAYANQYCYTIKWNKPYCD